MTEASVFQAKVFLGFQETLRCFSRKANEQVQSGSDLTDSLPDTDSFDRNGQRSQAALSNESITASHIE